MDPTELQRRWKALEPVEGVAFLRNDSVSMVSAAGVSSGRVAALLAIAPEPRYLVELIDGSEVPLPQSALVTASAHDPGLALGELQRWYSSRCNGDWEHMLGVQIETLDNPGLLVKIDIQGTPLDSMPFSSISKMGEAREWLECRLVEGQFLGAGGPHMLGAIIEVFLRWARAIGEQTG